MAFEVPSHLPRKPTLDTQDIATDVLTQIGSATYKTWNATLAASWLERIDSAMEATKVAIHDRIHEDLPEFERQSGMAESVQTRLGSLQGKVDDIERTVFDQQGGLIPTLIHSLSIHNALAQESHNARTTADALSHLVQCRDTYDELVKLVEVGDLPAAMRRCTSVEDVFGRVPATLGQSDVMRELKGSFRALRDRTEEELSDAFHKAVVVTPTTLTISTSVPVRNSSHHLSLSSILSSLPSSTRTAHLTTLRKNILAQYIDPVLAQSCTAQITQPSSNIHVLELSVAESDPTSSPLADNPTNRLEALGTIVAFIADTLCTQPLDQADEEQRNHLLTSLHKPIALGIRDRLLIPALPTSYKDLPPFLLLAETAAAFERNVLVSTLLRASDAEVEAGRVDMPIRDWAANVAMHYERHRRVGILERARGLVLGASGSGSGSGKDETCTVEVEIPLTITVEEDVRLDGVEVVQSPAPPNVNGGAGGESGGDAWGFDEEAEKGWGFDDEEGGEENAKVQPAAEEQDSWGFDDDVLEDEPPVSVLAEASATVPANPPPATTTDKPEEPDAWGFDEDDAPPIADDNAWDDDPWGGDSAAPPLAEPVPSSSSSPSPPLREPTPPPREPTPPLAPAPTHVKQAAGLAKKAKKGKLGGEKLSNSGSRPSTPGTPSTPSINITNADQSLHAEQGLGLSGAGGMKLNGHARHLGSGGSGTGSTSSLVGSTEFGSVASSVSSLSGSKQQHQPQEEQRQAQPKQKQKQKQLKTLNVTKKESYVVSELVKELMVLVEDIVAESEELASSTHFQRPSSSSTSTSLAVSSSSSSHGSAPSASSSSQGSLLHSCIPAPIDLFRAVHPVQCAAELKQPGRAMRFSNDLFYLGDRLDEVLKSRLSLGESENDRVTECREEVRAVGECVFDETVERYCDEVHQLLTEADGFMGTGEQERYDECENAVNGTLRLIRTLAQSWKKVLTRTKYYTALGTVVDAALSGMMEDILALADIPEVESQRLSELCKIFNALEGFFTEDVDKPPSTAAWVPSWLKFSYLSELLEASMADISYLFEEGALVDFEVDELATLVKALFSDTELRTKTLNRIMGGHPV